VVKTWDDQCSLFGPSVSHSQAHLTDSATINGFVSESDDWPNEFPLPHDPLPGPGELEGLVTPSHPAAGSRAAR
jgi:hypothetical protein